MSKEELLDNLSEENMELADQDQDEEEEGEDIEVQDFKKIINQYDENVVNTLMPFMVNILDCMNVGYQQKLEYEAKMQKVMKDNIKFQNKEKYEKKALEQNLEEYIVKYEAEREAKNFLETRITEYEKEKEQEKRAMESRVEALEIHVQTLEKKFRISTECIEKLEEREAYLKKEYSSLLERYTKLFKEHIEFMEKSSLPRLHRELLSDELFGTGNNIKKEDTAAADLELEDAEAENDVTDANEGEEEHLSDDQNTYVHEDFTCDDQLEDQEDMDEFNYQYEEIPIKEIRDMKIDETLLDELSLTQSIKNISHIPVKKHNFVL